MRTFDHNIQLYLATHSFGNMVLWPFGYSFDNYVLNWPEHVSAGQRWVDAVYARKGTHYVLGNSADILYTANGATDDYMMVYGHANMGFTLELTRGGSSGFDFPEAEVYELVKETFLGYRALGLYIKENYGSK